MPNITWNEASPADVDQVSGGDDAIRSLKTAIRVGLDSEHVWPSAGGDAGVHRIGSARAYYAAQSLVSSSGTDGRIMVASDTSRLFHVGSAGTMFLGGANTPSIGSAPVGGQRFFWAIETGENKIASAGQLVVTLPNSGFSGAPFVTLTTFDPTSAGLHTMLNTRTATTFTVNGFDFAGAPSNHSFGWISIGTRTF